METAGIVVGIVAGSLAIAGTTAGTIRWAVQRFRTRNAVQGSAFDKERFRLPSTHYEHTNFRIKWDAAGVEAPATPGAVVKGDTLVVCLQDQEVGDTSVGVWVTVIHPGQGKSVRWFGCRVTAYAYPQYETKDPALDVAGHHQIFDVYPGEQYTAFYFFQFSENAKGPKFLTTKSWDKELTFWWARGA